MESKDVIDETARSQELRARTVGGNQSGDKRSFMGNAAVKDDKPMDASTEQKMWSNLQGGLNSQW